MLLFTGLRFAYCLEGPADALAELDDSMRADQRHNDIVTLRREPVATRCFATPLGMVLNQSRFVADVVDRALVGARGGHHASIDGLARMLIEFGRAI